MSLTPAAREYLLALADDEHMIGARHTNWIGLGPFLEEDLAFCSIAQDELGLLCWAFLSVLTYHIESVERESPLAETPPEVKGHPNHNHHDHYT